MTPGTYNFNDHVKGNTLAETVITLTSKVGDGPETPIDISTASIKADFKKSTTSPVAITFSTGNGGITITDGPNGEFKFNPVALNLDPDKYYYDLKVTFTSGEIKTFMSGTLTILAAYTS